MYQAGLASGQGCDHVMVIMWWWQRGALGYYVAVVVDDGDDVAVNVDCDGDDGDNHQQQVVTEDVNLPGPTSNALMTNLS